MIEIKEVQTENEYLVAADLFKEYASQLGVDLSFQNFNKEIENISQEYARPYGALFIAYTDDKIPMGCFGIRKLENSICELKRMYLRTEARGLGLGRQLLRKAINVGKELGYAKMRLDTLPTMLSAIHLYTNEGFYEIAPYRFNPITGTKYMEVNLIE
ncbi:GNAT family N-acetyltransferase [Rhodocytophaga rosea]|uniref:GNAT family N-acetyltransferase n=1 Tax=Rhodocytophaga rosea TaxID=2704465 RepID=A0A6C0GCI9_9BACT|nr:GNAT family N-acetyltransferase [Rhodocytophaga rosea]QHT65564.1 GNAT family N-acetyltransferase [Rhodocytophaga rosea]